MPFRPLRGILRRVRALDHLERWQRLALIWTAALILIGGFAVLARYVQSVPLRDQIKTWIEVEFGES